MKKLAAILFLCCSLSAMGADNGHIHLFSFKYFKTSYTSELGLTFFTGFIRSPMMTSVYVSSETEAFPIPVYNWVYPLGTVSYEPQFRLLEIGSANSLSLNVPLAASLSLVQSRDADGFLYDPQSHSIPNVRSDELTERRIGLLGTGHAEFGGLLAYNLGQNATAENTWPVGLNLAVGYNFIYAPLFVAAQVDRSDFSQVTFWNHLVGRVGIQFRGIGFSHMFGMRPEYVRYRLPNESFYHGQKTNIYHRFAMNIHIGR